MIMLRKLKYILPAVMLVLMVGSCKRAYFYSGINDDPSQLKSPTSQAVLPSVELMTAYGYGGDQSRFISLFMQQVTGIANQSANANNYQITPDDVDNMWTFGLYGAIMANADTLIKVGKNSGELHYAAIGMIMMAFNLGSATDLWGDVPYTEAFQGLSNTSPKYDPQQQVYDTLHALLDRAITYLSTDDGAGFQPGESDDLVYGGDLDAWIAFAHSLKAKYYLHTVKVNGSAAITSALAEVADGFSSTSQDAFLKFVGNAAVTTQNPWYQFNTQRGDIDFSGYLNDLLNSSGDPRADVYFDGTDLGTLYGSANSPVYFMSYDELKFIEAELQFRNSNLVDAAAAYNAAVEANLQRTVGSTAYAATVAKTAATITLQDIIVQKYIALFLNPETWSDWRRTGYPALTAPPANVLNGALPRSLFYPSSEVRYNTNTPTNTTLTRRVWWDVQ
jgi:hypothetical protein